MVMSDREFERIKISVSLSNYIYDYTNLILTDESERRFVNRSLERRDGLKILLKDMYDNSDSRFIDWYKELFSNTFGFHRRKSMTDRHIDIFNKVFLFIEAYRYNRDSFDNFSSICDEILNNNYSKDFIFNSNRLDLIKRVISIKEYKDVPELNRFFKYLLTSSDEELSKSNLYYQNMMFMVESALSSEEDLSCDVSNSIIKYAMDNYKDNDIVVDILYSDHLLYGDRFDYINNKLREFEPNSYIRREIFSKISNINNDMFFELDYEDAFKKCLDVVFDSDTYYEIKSKLNDLIKASKIYEEDEKEALKLISELNSVKHKEVIDGIVMSWPENNNINKVEKPKQIIERMMKLHQTIPDAPNDEFYYKRSNSYYSKLTLKSFSERVISQIQENRTRKERELQQKAKEEAEALKLQEQEQAKKPKGLGSLFTKKNNN